MKLVDKIKRANFVYIIGNGGSASTANHFANDLVKMAGVKAISLAANVAVLTAYANDNGYENCYVDQLKVFLTKDDLLITISGSGTSPNIIKAKDYAKSIGAWVESLPTMKELDMNMQNTEDQHLIITHLVSGDL